MNERLRLGLILLSILGCGTMAGVFYAFSAFVMSGLGRLPAAQGAAAMQSINVTAVRPPLMIAFFGSALLCLAMIFVALTGWDRPGAGWRLAGSLAYLLGAFGVTLAFNVPRNEALAALDAASPEAAAYWAQYLRGWTLWNHLRAAACLAAVACFALGLR